MTELAPSLRPGATTATRAIDHLVIIAGGKGERLASLCPGLPKALVPIDGKPVLQHQLELAARNGVRGVTIFAGHLAGKIADFVGDGERFDLAIRICVEQEPLGNAGALLQSLDTLPERFFVVYGDVMLSLDMAEVGRRHTEGGGAFTLLAHPNDHPHDSDLIEADAEGWVTALHAYPHPADRFFGNLVNAGFYAVERDCLGPWARAYGKQDFTRDVMAGLIAARAPVFALRTDAYIKDMGTPERLRRVEAEWRELMRRAGRPHPAVFLDRDGTLNVERGFLRNPKDLELLPGAGRALRALRQSGYRLIVLTNQPVIARGDADEETVEAIHRRLEWELGKEGAYLDRIYLCPHHPDGGFSGERPELKIACGCRKPGLGLFDRACRDFAVDRASSWMIGDTTSDVEMARRAGLRSVLVRTGRAGSDRRFEALPDYVAADVAAAADLILAQRAPEPS